MSYEVSVAEEPQRPIAAVAATTTWDRFPGQWRGMLDEVWACLRQAGVKGGCNVMRYRDLPTPGHVAVEVGVEVAETFPVTGAVTMSALPAGLAAGTTHRGRFEEIGAAHQAVLRWCAAQRREITEARVRRHREKRIG
jgi:effector-binding domain-containing protein